MRERDRLDDFAGVAKDSAATALPPNLFQTDHGSSRFFRGTWSRRKGMLHSSLGKADNAVTSLLGFELPGGDYALAWVEGTNVHGDLNVDVQDNTAAPSGFGEDSFGEEGFGS